MGVKCAFGVDIPLLCFLLRWFFVFFRHLLLAVSAPLFAHVGTRLALSLEEISHKSTDTLVARKAVFFFSLASLSAPSSVSVRRRRGKSRVSVFCTRPACSVSVPRFSFEAAFRILPAIHDGTSV